MNKMAKRCRTIQEKIRGQSSKKGGKSPALELAFCARPSSLRLCGRFFAFMRQILCVYKADSLRLCGIAFVPWLGALVPRFIAFVRRFAAFVRRFVAFVRRFAAFVRRFVAFTPRPPAATA